MTTKMTSEQVAESCARCFADHELTELSRSDDYARVWRCAKPGTGIYSFTVAVWPGYLSINGDIGDLTLRRTTDMVAWARGAVRSPDYFFEKVVQPRQKIEEWSDAAFESWLQGKDDWTEEFKSEVRDAVGDENKADDLYEFLLSKGYCDAFEDVACCYDYDRNAWTCLEGVKKFLSLLDAKVEEPSCVT